MAVVLITRFVNQIARWSTWSTRQRRLPTPVQRSPPPWWKLPSDVGPSCRPPPRLSIQPRRPMNRQRGRDLGQSSGHGLGSLVVRQSLVVFTAVSRRDIWSWAARRVLSHRYRPPPPGQQTQTSRSVTELKLKPNKVLVENSSLSYGASPAIWDLTVLPATRHN